MRPPSCPHNTLCQISRSPSSSRSRQGAETPPFLLAIGVCNFLFLRRPQVWQDGVCLSGQVAISATSTTTVPMSPSRLKRARRRSSLADLVASKAEKPGQKSCRRNDDLKSPVRPPRRVGRGSLDPHPDPNSLDRSGRACKRGCGRSGAL